MFALKDNIAALRAGIRVSSISLLTLMLFLPQMAVLFLYPRFSLYIPWLFHRLAVKILGVTVKIIGKPEKSMLITNHLSWLDILVLGSVYPLVFISKNDVADWFLFGRLAKLQETIFVDRNSRTDIITSKEKIEKALVKSPVVLFAEGTTSDGSCVLPMNSSFVVTPAKAVVISYDKPAKVAWFGDMELTPHLWQVFKQPRLCAEVEFLETYDEGNRKLITKSAELSISASYSAKLRLSK